jgi:hypothetical protein
MFRPIPGHRQIHSWFVKHNEEEMYIMSFQSYPTRHIDVTSKTNATLSMQRKIIPLLSTHTLTSCWKRGSENMEVHLRSQIWNESTSSYSKWR